MKLSSEYPLPKSGIYTTSLAVVVTTLIFTGIVSAYPPHFIGTADKIGVQLKKALVYVIFPKKKAGSFHIGI
jgi:hypothetical protein